MAEELRDGKGACRFSLMKPTMSKLRGKSAHYGFTLLEVLVALVILSTAITLIIQLYSANLKAVFISGNEVAAAVRGDAKIREILLGTSVPERSWSETTEDGYRIDISAGEVLKERTDNLPVRLMEIILTVHWNEGLKEKKITIRTMKLIDRMSPAMNNLPTSA